MSLGVAGVGSIWRTGEESRDPSCLGLRPGMDSSRCSSTVSTKGCSLGFGRGCRGLITRGVGPTGWATVCWAACSRARNPWAGS